MLANYVRLNRTSRIPLKRYLSDHYQIPVRTVMDVQLARELKARCWRSGTCSARMRLYRNGRCNLSVIGALSYDFCQLPVVRPHTLTRREASCCISLGIVCPAARLSLWERVARSLVLHIAWVRLSRSQTLSHWERVARSLVLHIAWVRLSCSQTLSRWERVARSAG